jgi:ABC-type nitrate/sulfonate/bicarbonate transport system permease component
MSTVTETSKARITPPKIPDRAWLPNFKSKQLQPFRTPIMIVASLTVFFLLWQFVSYYILNPYLIPPPTKVLETAIPMIQSGELFRHAGISLMRVMVGFSLGSISAIVIGVIMGRLRIVNDFLDPIIEFLRYLSPTWGTFFFVLINTIAGVIRTPIARQRAAQCLGANQLQIFLTVVIPSAVPYIITGMRVAMASSFMAIIPAEMLAARSGLGYLLQVSGMLVQTDRIFVALATISLLGFLTDRLFRFLADRTLRRYMAFVTAS